MTKYLYNIDDIKIYNKFQKPNGNNDMMHVLQKSVLSLKYNFKNVLYMKMRFLAAFQEIIPQILFVYKGKRIL